MADSVLTLKKSEIQQATFEFMDTEYLVSCSNIDYLKAMDVYGQITKATDISKNEWIEKCSIITKAHDEAVRLVKKMIGDLSLMEILKTAEIQEDIDSISSILGACISAISNKMNEQKKKKIDAGLELLKDV